MTICEVNNLLIKIKPNYPDMSEWKGFDYGLGTFKDEFIRFCNNAWFVIKTGSFAAACVLGLGSMMIYFICGDRKILKWSAIAVFIYLVLQMM